MKIAILGVKTLPANAGADRVVEKFLENTSNANQYYVYLSSIDNQTKLNGNEKFHYIYIPSIKSKYFKAFIFFFFSSIHFLFKGDYDIAHIHNSDFGLFNVLIWLKRRTKIVGTFHGNPYLRDKWNSFGKAYLKISELLFLSFSDYLTTVAKSKINEIPSSFRKKISYIPNGIDKNIDFHLNDTSIKEYGVEEGNYLLFACGRLDPTKGLHHLINAYKELTTHEKLLIIGSFDHDKEYSKRIEMLSSNNTKIILYKKLLTKEELFLLLSKCKLFVFPSEIEAMSMMLLEAIACKVPIICSDIVENVDVVGSDYKYLFKNKDTKDLKIKIEIALEGKNLPQLTDQLHSKTIKKFNWQKIASEYENLYTQIKGAK